MTYTIVELSPILCERSKELLSIRHPELIKSNRLQVINDDILSFRSEHTCYMLLLEVLDNMPHDRVFRKNA